MGHLNESCTNSIHFIKGTTNYRPFAKFRSSYRLEITFEVIVDANCDTPRGLALSRRIQRNAVCADRNNITNNFVTLNLIAPYTGAWIEM